MFTFVLDVVTLVSSSVGIWAAVNTTYRCLSSVPFQVGEATVIFSNMSLEAYMPGNDLSPRGPALSCFCFLFFSFHKFYIWVDDWVGDFSFWSLSHRKCVCGRSVHHIRSNHDYYYDSSAPGTHTSRTAWARHLLCKQQRHHMSSGPNGTAAQYLLFFSFTK